MLVLSKTQIWCAKLQQLKYGQSVNNSGVNVCQVSAFYVNSLHRVAHQYGYVNIMPTALTRHLIACYMITRGAGTFPKVVHIARAAERLKSPRYKSHHLRALSAQWCYMMQYRAMMFSLAPLLVMGPGTVYRLYPPLGGPAYRCIFSSKSGWQREHFRELSRIRSEKSGA